MGYASHLHGYLTIHPPLTWAEFRNDFAYRSTDAVVRLSVTEMSTDTGITYTCSVVKVEEDAVKAYDLGDEIRGLILRNPDHMFNGTIVRAGEENGDVERYVVTDSEVRNETAVLRWPDGSDASNYWVL